MSEMHVKNRKSKNEQTSSIARLAAAYKVDRGLNKTIQPGLWAKSLLHSSEHSGRDLAAYISCHDKQQCSRLCPVDGWIANRYE